ncbi:hypothetical protein ABZT26_02760 [Streptomyces sp. NPDC005395]|uniref:hypothetical protein n=1 Tax=unclassified Streptomyces TaxID=2593676 RepID=UPI001F34BD0F|nr:hypothetical protein [Streptomyces sp. BSE6.1]
MIRRYHATGVTPSGSLASLILMFGVSVVLLRFYIEVVDATLKAFDDPPFGLTSNDFTLSSSWETVSDSPPSKFILIATLVLTFAAGSLFGLFVLSLVIREALRLLWKRSIGPIWNESRLAVVIAKAVPRAMAAYRCPPGSVAQNEALNALAYSLRNVYEELLRVANETRTVPFRSKRRDRLREHHFKVIAAIEEKEAAIDVDARTALPDLAETLMKIANAYSSGKIGQLLPDADLAHVTPFEPPKREHFKMVAVAVLLGGCGVLVAFLDLPDTATTSLIGALGIAIASMVYGRRAREAMDLLDSLRGIQRP